MIKEKASEIINHYRVLPQLKYFQSEVFELNEAIIREETKRYFQDTIFNKKNITEEIADVKFMLTQFQEYYKISDEQIEEIMNFKADRQLKRIEVGE